MKRILLGLAVVLVLGGVILAASVSAGDKITLKLATIVPDGGAFVNVLRDAGKEIEQQTAGRVKFKIYPGGVMGNDAVILRKFRTGQLHGSSFTAGGISQVYKNYQVMSLPLMIRNYQEADAVRAQIEPLLTQGLAAKGFISMGINEIGFAYLLSNKPVASVDQLRACKMWVPEGDPVSRVVFEEAGVPPVPLPLTDVLTGLNTGLIDTVANSPVGTVALQWFTKVKYLMQMPLIYTYSTFAFSERAWNKLTPSDQVVVREALSKRFRDMDQETRVANEQAMATLKKQGVQIVSFDQANWPQLVGIADRSIQKLIAKGNFDPALVNRIRAIVEPMRQGR